MRTLDNNYRLTNLDLLKIISAILIVFHHYQQVFDVKYSGINFYGGSFYFGRIVELFFIISGFVTAYRKSEEIKSVFKPIFKKCLRIFPAVALPLTFLLIIMLIYKSCFGTDITSQPCTLMRVICSYLLIFSGWGIDVGLGLNNPTWYICILLLCYVLYYCIEKICKNHYWIKIFVFVSVVGISLLFEQYNLFSKFPFIGTHNVRGYSCFFIGALINEFIVLINSKKLAISLSCLMIIAYVLLSLKVGFNHWQTLDVLFFPGIVLLAVSVKQIQYSGLNFWGAVSFEVYLWHVPMMRLITLVTSLLGVVISHTYLIMILFVLVLEIFASFVYQHYEVPVYRKLKTLFENN